MSASSELTSVKVRREAWAHTSRARASTLRVPYGSSWDGRRSDDKLYTKKQQLVAIIFNYIIKEQQSNTI